MPPTDASHDIASFLPGIGGQQPSRQGFGTVRLGQDELVRLQDGDESPECKPNV